MSFTQAFKSIIHVMPRSQAGKYVKHHVSQAAGPGEFHENFLI